MWLRAGPTICLDLRTICSERDRPCNSSQARSGDADLAARLNRLKRLFDPAIRSAQSQTHVSIFPNSLSTDPVAPQGITKWLKLRAVSARILGKTMRDAVRSKEWRQRRRTPTQDPSTDLAAARRARTRRPGGLLGAGRLGDVRLPNARRHTRTRRPDAIVPGAVLL